MVTKHGKTRFSGLPEEVERILEISAPTSTSIFTLIKLNAWMIKNSTYCLFLPINKYKKRALHSALFFC